MAQKIENEDMLTEAPIKAAPQKGTDDASSGGGGKKKVVVINVPKRKKPLRTPSHIIRITLIWCFCILLYMLTLPFLSVNFYITQDMEVTPNASEAYRTIASQQEIDTAYNSLKVAYDALELRPDVKQEALKKREASANAAGNSSETSVDLSEVSISADEIENAAANVREMETISYQWTYHVAEGVNVDKLVDLLDKSKKVDRDIHTTESIHALNKQILYAHKVLCASVTVRQNALQMMLGGAIGEAYGDYSYIGNIFLRGLCSFALGVLPLIAILACAFDKKRMIRHFVVLICSILALVDIFVAIYPYVEIGAVLSVTMYIIIILLNFGGIYAHQQEKYIINHPELEAEFTEKHPHFVKALINHKSFGEPVRKPDPKAQEAEAARNAKKRRQKKKKSK